MDKVCLPDEFLGSKVTRDQQDQKSSEQRTDFMKAGMQKAVEYFARKNNGRKPRQVIVYRDGIGGP